ncbi:unnamed protein product [Microthlaspi erraticum]|uniref:Integrase catalytic domain-containing protein n=1 Tax=Microthlaspi erraticum TaxID=1685480 RepID=A0A6D2KK57_9BRAS|nr:unnamed protein product [Microthlaspi erraticum]
MEPLPNMNQTYAKVKSVERVQTVVRGREQQGAQMAFAVRSGNMNIGGEDKSKLFCTECKKTGHVAETCFQVVGYPPWWGERARGGTGRGGDQSFSSRGGFGRGGGRGGRGRGVFVGARAHAVTTQESGESSNDAERNGFTGLTNEKWSKLIKILDDGKQSGTPRLSGKIEYSDWVLDTGASNHMTGSADFLADLKYILPCSIGLPNGQQTLTRTKGTVVFDKDFSLKNVLLVPELKCNLISVSQLIADTDCVMQIANKGCVLQDRITRNLTGAGELREGLYFFRRISTFSALRTNKDGAEELWHQRFGHPSNTVFDLIPFVGNRSMDFSTCGTCLKAKQCREVFHSSDNKSDGIFDLIHTDLWGPYRTPSLCNSFYFLTIVDDFSRAVWVYLLHDKSQVGITLKNFLALVSRQFDKRIKILRSDNGTEFTCLTSGLREQGIIHQTLCLGTPQQNGRVERKHRHILNVARALLFQSSLPVKFWGESVLAAAYLINRTPSSVLKGKTPYEVIHGKSPIYDNLRVFGCLAFAHKQKRDGDKFDVRSRKCIMLGYPFGKKGWTLFDLEKEEIFVSRDVVFIENNFPFKTEETLREDNISGMLSETEEDDDTYTDDGDQDAENDGVVEEVEAETASEAEHEDVEVPLPETGMENSDEVSAVVEQDEPAAQNEAAAEVRTEELGRGLRQKTTSVKLKDFVLNAIKTDEIPEFLADGGSSEYPISVFIDSSSFSPKYRAFLAAVTAGTKPVLFRDAVIERVWCDAMHVEIGALEKARTWDLTELPPGKKAIGCKWIYKIKFLSTGEVERYKARLVVLGNNQEEGTDYTETFAPVVRMTTVRTFLGVVAAKNWELHQMDVHNAFLHGDLDEEVYMKLPPGFRVNGADGSNLVCKLRKSLYGLKQAPQCWFEMLRGALLDYGFSQARTDYSMFSMRKNGSEIYVLVYVDDLIIGGNDSDGIKSFKAYLSECFHMKDLGGLKYFLGIEVARRPEGIFLCQR